MNQTLHSFLPSKLHQTPSPNSKHHVIKIIFPIPILYWSQSIFILWWSVKWGWGTDPRNTGKIFIFRCSFYMINDKHEILLKSYPTWLCPKILDLTLISVSVGTWRGFLWYVSSQILLLRDINGQIINQHIICDQKREKLTICIKK